MLCVCCVALAACGGSGSGSAAASSSAADPAAKFVGTWKLAGGETQGMTVVGDFASMLGIEDNFQMTVKEDGTGSMSFGGETKTFTWEASGENTMAMKPSADGASGDSSASSASAEAEATTEGGSTEEIANELTEFTYEDGKLTATVTNEGQTIKIIFTQDGTIPGAPVIDSAKAAPITSEADLIGTWKLSGMNLMGMTVYGESDAIAQMSGGTDTSLTFEEGGKCTMSGVEGTYAVTANGATINQDGAEMEVKSLDGSIVIDAGAASGLDLEMVMMYSK